MTIATYTVSVLEAGDFRLDGGAMFGVVPKVLWNRLCPADEQNRIAMTCRCLLIEGNNRRILVDAGIGDKEGEKFTELYAVDFRRSTLERALAARNLTPNDITDVIISHLHFDHAGGCTRIEDGKVVPTFPRARYYVQARQWNHAQSGLERDRASFLPRNYLPLRDAGQLELLDGDCELLPGLCILVANGHTPGMQTVLVKTENKTVWYPADLLPTAAHIPLPYIMSYDLFPVTTLEERKRLWPQAVEENWIIVFEHDPQTVACRLVVSEKGQVVRGPDVIL